MIAKFASQDISLSESFLKTTLVDITHQPHARQDA